jgi:hypothetical protein
LIVQGGGSGKERGERKKEREDNEGGHAITIHLNDEIRNP